MSRIRILPEQLANQIAAGEVVERPASVVKELVENSIDAGSSYISVQVEGDGVRMIRIIDNGEGMDQDDILLSLERHATSKIASAEELCAIATLGFRGEAIPSIAAVSRFTITSRTRETDLGARAEVSFGRLVKVHDMGCARGTVMEVSDLFGNLPARRKFLKSPRTELAHIEETLTDCALAHSGIGFEYSVDGREIFRLPASADARDRVRRLFGAAAREGLVAVAAGMENGAGVSGWLVPPAGLSGTAAKLRVFINLRPVRDRMLTHAVSEGMQGYLMKGMRPAGVLFLAVDHAEVDVNVHPTKQEVRFRRPNQVHQAVALAVSAAMKGYEQNRREEMFGIPPAKTGGDHPRPRGEEPPPPWLLPFASGVQREHLPFAENNSSRRSEPGGTLSFIQEPAPIAPAALEAREPSQTARASGTENPARNPLPPAPSFRMQSSPAPAVAPPVTPVPPPSPSPEPLRYIGQFAQSFLIFESDGGLVVIDQHAAQERLLYEDLRVQHAKNGVASQTLLFPALMELSPADMQAVEQYAEEIARLGLELAPFGGRSFLVKAVPAILTGSPPEEVVRTVLDQFGAAESGARGTEARIEAMLATLACKAAVKAGAALLPEEARHLARRMQEADAFAHCPHGRPVARLFSLDDVRRWFKRL